MDRIWGKIGTGLGIIGIIGVVGALLGCSGIFRHVTPKPAGGTKQAAEHRLLLDRVKPVFVAVPDDGGLGNEIYLGSGRAVAQAIATAFARQTISVYVADRQLAPDEILSAAKRVNAGYLVWSVITSWDPRNQWAGMTSRLAVTVTIEDLATGRVIDSRSIETGKIPLPAVTVSSPQALLEKPLDSYVSSFY